MNQTSKDHTAETKAGPVVQITSDSKACQGKTLPVEDAALVAMAAVCRGDCLVPGALFDKLHPNASPVVIRISGDSMAPTYPDGCRVLVDAAVVAPSPPGVFVLWDGTAHVVARCQVLIGSNPPTVRMTYDNSGMKPIEVPLSSLTVSGSVAGIVDQPPT